MGRLDYTLRRYSSWQNWLKSRIMEVYDNKKKIDQNTNYSIGTVVLDSERDDEHADVTTLTLCFQP